MRDARPWLGFFVGLVLGLTLAIILQQAGVWPLDQLMVFVLVGLFALLGSWLGGFGRQSVGALSTYLPLVLAVALIGYGAIGLGDIDQHGNINGGCEAFARSSVDTTDVFDTTRGDPFRIDPNGSVEWLATSPAPIMDHNWGIYVEFAGFDILIDSGTHPNRGGSEISSGQADDLSGYINEVTNVSGQPLLGTFIVSGDISVDSTVVCDGFGFVRLTSDNPFESLVSKIAAALALLMLIILLLIVMRRGSGVTEEAAPLALDRLTPGSDGQGPIGAGPVAGDDSGDDSPIAGDDSGDDAR